MSDTAPKLRQWYISLLTAGHEVTDLLEIADHIDSLEVDNERLRAALREIVADIDGHNALTREHCGDELTWVSVERAKEALGERERDS